MRELSFYAVMAVAWLTLFVGLFCYILILCGFERSKEEARKTALIIAGFFLLAALVTVVRPFFLELLLCL